MRRRWPMNTVGRKIRKWGGHAAGGQVPGCWSLGFNRTLLYKQTHTGDQTYTQFGPVPGLRQRRSCVSHGAPVLLRQQASHAVGYNCSLHCAVPHNLNRQQRKAAAVT